MRGTGHQQCDMFGDLSAAAWVRKDHPLRAMWTMVDEVLRALSAQFNDMYAKRVPDSRQCMFPRSTTMEAAGRSNDVATPALTLA
jgi:hypothetical protein